MSNTCEQCGFLLDDDGHCYECEQRREDISNLIDLAGRKEIMEKKKYDSVDKPIHYNVGGIEAIDAILAATNDLSEGYLQGNILKYVWRYRYKNQIEDLKKARWYLNKLIEIYEHK
jgi:hypothetical protein